MKNDPINNPSHYTQGIECADYIESHDMDFFQGNAIKYLTRFRHKGTPLEDLKKARWYLERLIAAEEKKDSIPFSFCNCGHQMISHFYSRGGPIWKEGYEKCVLCDCKAYSEVK